jgi:hypothetical protein
MVDHVVHRHTPEYEEEEVLPTMVFVKVDEELLLHHDMATIVMVRQLLLQM